MLLGLALAAHAGGYLSEQAPTRGHQLQRGVEIMSAHDPAPLREAHAALAVALDLLGARARDADRAWLAEVGARLEEAQARQQRLQEPFHALRERNRVLREEWIAARPGLEVCAEAKVPVELFQNADEPPTLSIATLCPLHPRAARLDDVMLAQISRDSALDQLLEELEQHASPLQIPTTAVAPIGAGPHVWVIGAAQDLVPDWPGLRSLPTEAVHSGGRWGPGPTDRVGLAALAAFRTAMGAHLFEELERSRPNLALCPNPAALGGCSGEAAAVELRELTARPPARTGSAPHVLEWPAHGWRREQRARAEHIERVWSARAKQQQADRAAQAHMAHGANCLDLPSDDPRRVALAARADVLAARDDALTTAAAHREVVRQRVELGASRRAVDGAIAAFEASPWPEAPLPQQPPLAGRGVVAADFFRGYLNGRARQRRGRRIWLSLSAAQPEDELQRAWLDATWVAIGAAIVEQHQAELADVAFCLSPGCADSRASQELGTALGTPPEP